MRFRLRLAASCLILLTLFLLLLLLLPRDPTTKFLPNFPFAQTPSTNLFTQQPVGGAAAGWQETYQQHNGARSSKRRNEREESKKKEEEDAAILRILAMVEEGEAASRSTSNSSTSSFTLQLFSLFGADNGGGNGGGEEETTPPSSEQLAIGIVIIVASSLICLALLITGLILLAVALERSAQPRSSLASSPFPTMRDAHTSSSDYRLAKIHKPRQKIPKCAAIPIYSTSPISSTASLTEEEGEEDRASGEKYEIEPAAASSYSKSLYQHYFSMKNDCLPESDHHDDDDVHAGREEVILMRNSLENGRKYRPLVANRQKLFQLPPRRIMPPSSLAPTPAAIAPTPAAIAPTPAAIVDSVPKNGFSRCSLSD